MALLTTPASKGPTVSVVLIQLSGIPGSGKSALAREIARATGFVVVDTDVLKSALIEGGVPVAASGKATYAAALGIAADLIEQGKSVVLDSPCRYQELLDAGLAIANDAGVRYGFIELWTPDVSAVLMRLDARTPKASQVASATDPAAGTDWEFGTAEATLLSWQEQLMRPEDDWLRLDATLPTEAGLKLARRYLDSPQLR
jgi:predicted kinase